MEETLAYSEFTCSQAAGSCLLLIFYFVKESHSAKEKKEKGRLQLWDRDSLTA